MHDNDYALLSAPRVIRRPKTRKMPWRTSAPAGPLTIRKAGEAVEAVNVILAETHPDVVAAMEAVTGSRGICGCGDPATKVQHPAVNGGRPTWIHDHSPEVAHPVANVRCVTRP